MTDWCYCLLAPVCCLYFYLLPNAACWLLCNDHFPLPPVVTCCIVLATLFTLLFWLLADPACCLIPNICCLRQDTDTWWKYILILYLMLPYHLLCSEYCWHTNACSGVLSAAYIHLCYLNSGWFLLFPPPPPPLLTTTDRMAHVCYYLHTVTLLCVTSWWMLADICCLILPPADYCWQNDTYLLMSAVCYMLLIFCLLPDA